MERDNGYKVAITEPSGQAPRGMLVAMLVGKGTRLNVGATSSQGDRQPKAQGESTAQSCRGGKLPQWQVVSDD